MEHHTHTHTQREMLESRKVKFSDFHSLLLAFAPSLPLSLFLCISLFFSLPILTSFFISQILLLFLFLYLNHTFLFCYQFLPLLFYLLISCVVLLSLLHCHYRFHYLSLPLSISFASFFYYFLPFITHSLFTQHIFIFLFFPDFFFNLISLFVSIFSFPHLYIFAFIFLPLFLSLLQ